jgi:hypothetical protein
MHRTGEMLFILKTLLLATSSKKLDVYQTQFRTVFKGREPLFDELLAVIGTFYNAYQEFPDPNELLERLQAEGHIKQADYLSNLLSGTLTAAEEDFFFHVADYDLRNNPRPGTLYIDQPNKSKFRFPICTIASSHSKRLCPSIVVWSIISPSCIRWNRSVYQVE